MPELPEVEHAARVLRAAMLGVRVERVAAPPSRVLRGQSPRRFAASLAGRTLREIDRRGKLLLLTFDAGVGLLAHLGMTGKLVVRPRSRAEPYSRVRFELASGLDIHFRDPRKFGQLLLAPADALARLPQVAALGPDAFREPPTAATLRARFERVRRPVKVALLDQAILSGLGNIYATEALFRARLSPRRRARALDLDELGRLADGIRETLELAVASLASTEGDIAYLEEPGTPNPFLVYGRQGEPCPCCRASLRSMVQAGRTTTFCPSCQK